MLARIKRISPYKLWLGLLFLLMAVGAAAGLIVLVKGLVVTNLSDVVPWGLWITLDISSIALAAGAFTFCAAVYLLKMDQLRPMAKTAAYVGLTGYTMAMLCLFLDIGRPDRFYYGFIYWNVHSVLWEVTMCVGLYFTVLVLENLPTIADWDWLQMRFPRLTQRMHKVHDYAPYLAVAGLVFSLLHQSSLGATYGVIISRPVWYRPGLAILFIYSAVAGGLAITTAVTMLARRFNKNIMVKGELTEKVAHTIGWIMVGYLYLRFWDLFAMTYTYQPGKTEALALLTRGQLSFNFWFAEILLGAVVPVFLLLKTKWRTNPNLRLLALLLIVGGVVAYRWDINLLGLMLIQPLTDMEAGMLYASYRPALIEWLTAGGVLAFGMLLLTMGIKYLKVVDHSPQPIHVHGAD